MLELMKKPRTDGMVEVCAVVPQERLHAVELAIQEAAAPSVPWREVFPDSTPGSRLRGARGLREMTQKELAAALGVLPQHISDMENNRRTIGKAMAKRLGEALNFPYKTFL